MQKTQCERQCLDGLGVQRYAEVAIRYSSRYSGHDTIRHDTICTLLLSILSGSFSCIIYTTSTSILLHVPDIIWFIPHIVNSYYLAHRVSVSVSLPTPVLVMQGVGYVDQLVKKPWIGCIMINWSDAVDQLIIKPWIGCIMMIQSNLLPWQPPASGLYLYCNMNRMQSCGEVAMLQCIVAPLVFSHIPCCLSYILLFWIKNHPKIGHPRYFSDYWNLLTA